MNVFRQILLVLFVLATAASVSGQEPWISRLSTRHSIGDGVGYQDGLTSVDWFLPLLPGKDDDLWFADFRAMVSNDYEFSSNVGTGYRWYTPEQNRIYGFNAFWDTRQFDGFTFNQAGVGFETLGEHIDFEANGYTPAVNDTNQRSLAFIGNNLSIHTVHALSGADFLLGYNIPAIHEFHTRVLGGGYYFDSNKTADATGWRVKLETAFRDWLSVSAVAQDDDLFGRNLSVSIELRKPIEHKSDVVSSSMRHKFRSHSGGAHDDTIRHRLADPVHRQQQIVLTEHTHLATDPENAPLTFIHVVPDAAGTGTFENPYGSIDTAMDDELAETSIVYTPQGGTFNETVTLAENTQLRSNGPSQFVTSLQGPLILPFSGTTSDLTMLPSVINGNVNLEDNTVVNGFAVTGTVQGNGVKNATVDTSRIRQPLAMDAIALTNNSTDITLSNLLVDQSGARGIGIENSSAKISTVTLSTITGDAIEINNEANANTVSIADTTITGTTGEGIDANLNGEGNLTLFVQQSSIASTGHAFSAVADAAPAGDLTVAIANSTATSTSGTGFTVDGSAGAGTTFVSQFQDNTVGEATAGGATFTGVVFDADPGAEDPVSFSSLLVGTATGRVTGNGVSFTNTMGDVDMGNVDIFNVTGSGLFVSTTSSTLTLRSQAGSTIDTSEGPALNFSALNLSDVKTALVFDSVVSVNSPTEAAAFITVDGSLAVTTTVVTDAVNPPFLYDNIPDPFDVSFGNTTINSLQGPLITDNETHIGDTDGLPDDDVIYNPLQIIYP
ncbi:MAG: inverse autotransporter beta domain-containing protein [Fuerstiella sp.]|nr:inverse autotransporter beta domain-containing protein [Fuerstiella sp.]